jgi:hypothetical protein
MKDWEIIAHQLSAARWTWGYYSTGLATLAVGLLMRVGKTVLICVSLGQTKRWQASHAK